MPDPFRTAAQERKRFRKSKGAPGGIIGEMSSVCIHDYRYAGSSGGCVLRECAKCGDQYEKDVS